MTKIWVEHADDMVKIIRALENATKVFVEHPKSDLEFNIPNITANLYGDPSGFSIIYDDDAWYIGVGEQNDI